MINYEYDSNLLTLVESPNEQDIEFRIRLKDPAYEHNIHEVRSFYSKNRDLTDVLFYTHLDHEFQVIVRTDYYNDFLITLFKHKLLTGLRWS